jgi:hypothetical protein
MLRLRQNNGGRIMVLWQFITFTVLIGAVVVYAGVITRRLGCANARLNRIEEALLATSRPIDFADARAAESKPEVSSEEGRVGYLTIRDLKVRSEQLRSRATHSSSRNSVGVSESQAALKTRSEQASSRDTRPLNVNSVPASLVSQAPVDTSSEPLSSAVMQPLSDDSVGTGLDSRAPMETSSEPLSSVSAGSTNGDSVADSSQSRDAPETTSEQQSPPGHRPPSEDSAATKNRDALLFLSNQRRRRRARLGY